MKLTILGFEATTTLFLRINKKEDKVILVPKLKIVLLLVLSKNEILAESKFVAPTITKLKPILISTGCSGQ